MAIFNSYVTNYQRVPILASQGWSEQGAGLVAIEDEAGWQVDAQKLDTWVILGGVSGWILCWTLRIIEGYTYLVGGFKHEFYDFPYIGKNNPNWLIFSRGVKTTNEVR